MKRVVVCVAMSVALAFVMSAFAQGTDKPKLNTKQVRTEFVKANDKDESGAFEGEELHRISELDAFAHKNLMKFCGQLIGDPALYGVTEAPICHKIEMEQAAVRLWIKHGASPPAPK